MILKGKVYLDKTDSFLDKDSDWLRSLEPIVFEEIYDYEYLDGHLLIKKNNSGNKYDLSLDITIDSFRKFSEEIKDVEIDLEQLETPKELKFSLDGDEYCITVSLKK